jgi:hypothetical protein
VEDAQAAGFRAPRARNLAGNAGPAATAPAGSAGDTGSGVVDPHVIGRNPEPSDVAPASDLTDSLNRYSDPQVGGGGRLTEEVMDAQAAGTTDPFGSGADDIESLQRSSPDDIDAVAEAPAGETVAGQAGAVQGDGTRTCPAGYPIKGNASSMIYHVPGTNSYDNTVPEWCFATEGDAQQAGYRAPRR